MKSIFLSHLYSPASGVNCRSWGHGRVILSPSNVFLRRARNENTSQKSQKKHAAFRSRRSFPRGIKVGGGCSLSLIFRQPCIGSLAPTPRHSPLCWRAYAAAIVSCLQFRVSHLDWYAGLQFEGESTPSTAGGFYFYNIRTRSIYWAWSQQLAAIQLCFRRIFSAHVRRNTAVNIRKVPPINSPPPPAASNPTKILTPPQLSLFLFVRSTFVWLLASQACKKPDKCRIDRDYALASRFLSPARSPKRQQTKSQL